MIVYNPADGDAFTTSIPLKPRHCFLLTRLGKPVPPVITNIRKSVIKCCKKVNYDVIDASTEITGRDFLIKIWKMIASTPLVVGVVHEKIPDETQHNIYYEIGVAQSMGKETVLVKSPKRNVPSDLIRSEFILYDQKFENNFERYLDGLNTQAEHYELVADQVERNPVLALDYLKRAYLITGNHNLKTKVTTIVKESGLEDRARNSVELLSAAF